MFSLKMIKIIKFILLLFLITHLAFFNINSQKVIVLSDLHIGKNNQLKELNNFILLSSKVIEEYKNEQIKPVIILNGDIVDHCNTHVGNVGNNGHAITLGEKIWYDDTTPIIKNLLDEGFIIIPVLGNHDASSLEKYNSILDVKYDGTADFEGKRQTQINNGLKEYAEGSNYDKNYISGINIEQIGLEGYNTWVNELNHYNHNFLLESYNIKTKYDYSNKSEDLIKKLFYDLNLLSKKTVSYDINKSGIIKSIKKILEEEYVFFTRGFEILPISSIDIKNGNYFINDKKYLTKLNCSGKIDDSIEGRLGTNIPFTLNNSRLLMSDGRIRFANGIVDNNEILKVKEFILYSNQRYKKDIIDFELSFKEKAESLIPKNLSTEIKNEILDIKTPIYPRPVRTINIHHWFDYQVLGIQNTMEEMFIDFLIFNFNLFEQNPNNNNINQYKSLLSAEYSLFNFISRFKFVPRNDLFELFRGLNSNSIINDLSDPFEKLKYFLKCWNDYGKGYGDIKYPDIYFPKTNKYSIESGNFTKYIDTDVIINLRSNTIEAVLIDEDIYSNKESMHFCYDSFLESLEGIDCVIVGHRHKTNFYNYSSIFDKELENYLQYINLINNSNKNKRNQITREAFRHFLDYRWFNTATAPSNMSNQERVQYNQLVNNIKEEIKIKIENLFFNTKLETKTISFYKNKILKWMIESPSSNDFIENNIHRYGWVEINSITEDEMIKPKLIKFKLPQ